MMTHLIAVGYKDNHQIILKNKKYTIDTLKKESRCIVDTLDINQRKQNKSETKRKPLKKTANPQRRTQALSF